MSVADLRRSAGRGATTPFQGEALILELRSVKEILDRERRRRVHKTDSSHRAPRTGPQGVVRQFPRAVERLDQFDQNLLQQPISGVKSDERPFASAADARPSKLAVFIGEHLQALQRQLKWLLTGAGRHDDAGFGFVDRVLGRHDDELKAASRILIASVAVAGSWATLVPLSAAVVLPGTLVVQSSVKKIQHPTGGVIAEIAVHDGMHIASGTLLARLDETQAQASHQVIANQLDQVSARIARLIGERDGLSEIQLPKQLAERMKDAAVAHLVASETSLFNARASERQGKKELYQSNILQFEKQIDGLEAEIKSKSSQIDLIAKELGGVQELFAKGLVPLTRMTTLQRESAQLEGERAQLTATIAETKSKIGQAQLQIVQIDQNFRADVMKDLRESQDKEAELSERNVAAKDQLRRIDIRAPTAGVIHQLAIHTIGGVVRPGDVIMEIVPDSDDLQIEARLPPNEIDQVRIGQQANARFSTLDRQTMPQAKGAVTYVSADLSHDQQSNAGFYTVRIDLPNGERHHLNGLTLVSGMPVEVFLQTGSRTMMGYLFKPITDQFHRMFNEP